MWLGSTSHKRLSPWDVLKILRVEAEVDDVKDWIDETASLGEEQNNTMKIKFSTLNNVYISYLAFTFGLD